MKPFSNLDNDRQGLSYLNGGEVALQPDDLSDQLVVPHPDELVHGGSRHLLRRDDGSGDGVNVAELALAILVADLGQLLVHGAGHDDLLLDQRLRDRVEDRGGRLCVFFRVFLFSSPVTLLWIDHVTSGQSGERAAFLLYRQGTPTGQPT